MSKLNKWWIVALILQVILLLCFYNLPAKKNSPASIANEINKKEILKTARSHVENMNTQFVDSKKIKKEFQETLDAYERGEVDAKTLIALIRNRSFFDTSLEFSLWHRAIQVLKKNDAELFLKEITSEKTYATIRADAMNELMKKAQSWGGNEAQKLSELLPEGYDKTGAIRGIISAGKQSILDNLDYLASVETEHNGIAFDAYFAERLQDFSDDELLLALSKFKHEGASLVGAELVSRIGDRSQSTNQVATFCKDYKLPGRLIDESFGMYFQKMRSPEIKNQNFSTMPEEYKQVALDKAAYFVERYDGYKNTLDWIVTLPSDASPNSALSKQFGNWLLKNNVNATDWLKSLPKGGFQDSGIVAVINYLNRPNEKEIRKQWINSINDEKLRAELLEKNP